LAEHSSEREDGGLGRVKRKLWDGVIEHKDDDTSFDTRSFNGFGKSAAMWLEQSHGLHWAAEALGKSDSATSGGSKRPFNYLIALMLGGYAIETLLKMVIVADHCGASGLTLDDKSAKAFLPAIHDLPQLTVQARIRVNAQDRTLLSELSRYTIWAGRYPIPLLAAGYDGPAIFDGVSADRAKRQAQQWGQYDTLYRKLHRLAVRKVFGGQVVSA
jgi:hypothetical protein